MVGVGIVLLLFVGPVLAASPRVPRLVPWIVPVAIFAVAMIDADREHAAALARGSGDDDGNVVEALAWIVLVVESALVLLGYTLRRRPPPGAR